MAIVLKEKTSTPIPEGTHYARCFRVVDCGTQPDSGFGERKKLIVSWELPHERITVDGKELPKATSKIYSQSLNKKATLRQDLDRWRGRAFTKEELEHFEIAKILGTACQISIIHNGESSKVDGVMSIPKGTEVPPVFNKLVEFSIADGKNETYKALPEWIQKMCDSCLEWNPPKTPEAPEHPDIPAEYEGSSDVPF